MPNRQDPGSGFNWDSRSVRARIRAQKRLEAEDRQAKPRPMPSDTEDRERDVPDGFELKWVDESTLGGSLPWELVAQADSKPCRWSHGGVRCAETSVARLDRGEKGPQWWHYCASHLFGRRINEGRIECQILVHGQEGTD